MKKPAIGIDLGTSTSVVSYLLNGKPQAIIDPESKSPLVQSIVARNRRGEVIVGNSAANLVDQPGMGIREVKRLMGSTELVTLSDETYRPEEISALILRELRRNAETALGIPIEDAVITVPAYFPDSAKQATLAAADIAGIGVLRLINEPTAAALAYGIENLNAEELVLVFDFGGGTLDVTILELIDGVVDVRVSDGDHRLGGKDFDDCLLEHIVKKWKVQSNITEEPTLDVIRSLKAKVEAAKKELTNSYNSTIFYANFIVYGGIPHALDIDISRQEFDECTAHLIIRAKACLESALKKADIPMNSVTRILLVGGSTYMPSVRKLVGDFFRVSSFASDPNPDLAVSLGAAVMAGLLVGEIDESQTLAVSDVAPMGFGIDILTDVGGQIMLVYEPLIEPNQKKPVTIRKQYRLLHPDQRNLEIRIFQDREGTGQVLEDVEDTGISGIISDIPPALYGEPHPIEVIFSYSVDGVIEMRAEIPGIGKRCDVRYEPSANRMSLDERSFAKERIDELWKQSPLHKKHAAILSRANKLVTEKDDPVRAELSAMVGELENAIREQDDARCEVVETRLLDYIFRLETNG